MTSTLHTFTVSTWADSRSNRRDRTYIVQAETAEKAMDEAVMLAYRDVRHWVSIYPGVEDVDGNGPPAHCAHVDACNGTCAWVLRWDGGHDCYDCAGVPKPEWMKRTEAGEPLFPSAPAA